MASAVAGNPAAARPRLRPRGTAAPLAARPAPWDHARGLAAVVAGWREDPKVARQLVLDHVQAARAAQHAPLPDDLHPGLRAALGARGIDRLYRHQAAAYAEVRAGRHVVVATPTASGKSLCYNLPILQALAEQPDTRALYLFPTKALARDQEEALRRLLIAAALRQGAVTYDGDTPGDARRAAREQGGLLLTNPDMLHSGILPHHTAWSRFFSALRYIVIDELHVYRGVFGSHVANVLRRLLRVARFHGATPTVIFASATIGNAQAHAEQVLGTTVSLVDTHGAPQGARHVLVYNPPVVNAALGIRASCVKSAVRLGLDLVRAEVPTLIFGQSRNNVEVMLKYLRDRVAAAHVDPESIQSYRGGYLPETRRRIEAGLRAGDVRCVVATNALELGIDIGALDAVICAGYPGSVAGLWQRFGRGGRRGADSLAVLVASSAPMDQYWALWPEALLGQPIEEAHCDPDNVEVLVQHLKCGAFELPFHAGDGFGDLPAAGVADGLSYLAQHQVVHPVAAPGGGTTYHWATDHYPAVGVSLRQVGWDNFVIIDRIHDRTIAEMDWRSAHTMLHEQAIYQHAGEQWQVEWLDYDNRKAYVRAVTPDYYTDAMTHLKIRVLADEAEAPLPQGRVAWGEVSLVERVVGFKKIKFHTHENVGYGEVRLPEMQMHTTSMWLTLPAPVVRALPWPRAEVVDGLRGVGHLLHTVAAVGLMVDPRDLGRSVDDGHDQGLAPGALADFDPTLHLFDRAAGGIGLAPRLFAEHAVVLARAAALLARCPCADGCPACIGPAAAPPAGAGAGALSRGGVQDAGRRIVAARLLSAFGAAIEAAASVAA